MSAKKQDMTMVMLSGSAVVMLVVLVLVHFLATPSVFGGSMVERGGDYVATMAKISEGQEGLFVIDARSKTLGIYQFDPSTKALELRRTLTIEAISSGTVPR